MERDRLRSVLSDSVLAHTLRFEKPLAPMYDDGPGMRMLVAFVVVGIGMLLALRAASAAAGFRGLPAANLAIVVVLFVAFLLVQRAFVRLPAADVGLRRFADWTRRERLYFLQVVPLAAVVFAVVFRGRLMALLDERGLIGFLLFSVLTGLAWGMVQEFLYRGWLQTELTRRFGATHGLLAANVVFTFGPLHVDYFSGPIGGMRWDLVAVFGIGLFFGIVYRRSGNLWIPAVLHGLWPLNMT